jgi:hypothetical protein
MKCWNSIENDLYSYLFMNYKDEIKKRIEELSAVCIIGEMLLWPEDRNRYLTYCENSVQSIFERNEILNNYKLFLFVIQEIENPNSKVERYKKFGKQFLNQ